MKVMFDDGIQRKTVSRWIKRKLEVVTPRHSLSDYADKENGELWLDYFTHCGRKYALGQFEHVYPIMDTEDKGIIIGAYDSTIWWNPYALEIHPDGEYVRLWEDISKE